MLRPVVFNPAHQSRPALNEQKKIEMEQDYF
jgi:hypothetical protein